MDKIIEQVLPIEESVSEDFFRALANAVSRDITPNISQGITESLALAETIFSLPEKAGMDEVVARTNKKTLDLEHMLWERFGNPDFEKPESLTKLVEILSRDIGAKGFFLKCEKAAEFLRNVADKDGFAPLARMQAKQKNLVQQYGSLRFLVPREKLNDALEEFYKTVTPLDFEERDIAVEIFSPELAAAASEFVAHKYHNLTHLKELGVIFIIPGKLENRPGYFLRNLGLLIHYFYEVRFYSSLFRQSALAAGTEQTFARKFIYALQGITPEPTSKPHEDILIIQRYLSKDAPDDRRLFLPRVNTEAFEYTEAERYIGSLTGVPWEKLSFCGSLYPSETGQDQFFSFNFLDLAMNLFSGSVTTYHQRESIWNYVISAALGKDRTRDLLQANFFSGSFSLRDV